MTKISYKEALKRIPKTTTYEECLKWIALNDDTEFLKDDEPIICITGSMVCHLFGVSEKKFVKDLKAKVRQLWKLSGQ